VSSLDRDEVCAFLYFGYLPPRSWNVDARSSFEVFTERIEQSPEGTAIEELVERGGERWRAVFSSPSERLNVVPLSGGIDSRAILAGLLETRQPGSLRAVTFGLRGSLDYEIGRRVARAAGVESVGIDLAAVPLERDRLLDVAATTTPGWLFDTFFNRLMADRVLEDGIWWSGFMGDTLAGSRLPVRASDVWAEAVRRHVATFRAVASVDLLPGDVDPTALLPTTPLGSSAVLSFDEQLNFFARQPPAHLPVLVDPRTDIRTPFLDARWRDFILGVPRELRVGKNLYKRILFRAFPELMHLPEKGNFGLPADAADRRVDRRKQAHRVRRRIRSLAPKLAVRPNRMANYLDFDLAVRRRDDVRTLVRDAIRSLSARGVVEWLDLEGLWTRHVRGTRNHGDALMMLAALDLNLEAEERGQTR